MFSRIGRSRRPQTEAPLEVKAIFRRCNCNFRPAFPLTNPWSIGPGVVASAVRSGSFHEPRPAFPLSASPNRARRLLSANIAALASTRLTSTYVLAALYLLEDSHSARRARHFRDECGHTDALPEKRCEIRWTANYRAGETAAVGSFSRSCSLRYTRELMS